MDRCWSLFPTLVATSPEAFGPGGANSARFLGLDAGGKVADTPIRPYVSLSGYVSLIRLIRSPARRISYSFRRPPPNVYCD
jgi:hypothetical protein